MKESAKSDPRKGLGKCVRGSTNDVTQIYDTFVPKGQHSTVWDRVCSQDLD